MRSLEEDKEKSAIYELTIGIQADEETVSIPSAMFKTASRKQHLAELDRTSPRQRRKS